MCVIFFPNEGIMARPAAFISIKSVTVIATLTASLMLGACAQDGKELQSSLFDAKSAKAQAQEAAEASEASSVPKSELEKATDYWGKKHRENPRDADAALSYAKNLKAMGERQLALGVIKTASANDPNNKKVASEYGRLALELDQISIAKQMLQVADDPAAPDWRVISARGTVAAKEGKYSDAIPLYERALMLSQEQTSVMNNLAMAYAMAGEAGKAEEILRRIEAKGGNGKSRQNLALVLGLQGKFDESKALAAQELGSNTAAADTEMLKRMVKADGVTKPTPAKAAKAAQAAIKPAVGETTWHDETVPAKVAGMSSEASGSGLKGMSQ